MTTATTHRPASNTAAVPAIILAIYFMILLDNSIIFTALRSIGGDVRRDGPVMDAERTHHGVRGLLLGSRVGGLLGRCRVFVAGLAVFATASLIGLAPNGWWLI